MADDDLSLKITADMSDVRRKLDELENTPVTVRVQPRDAAGRFRGWDYGMVPYGGGEGIDSPAAAREEARVSERIADGASSIMRLDQVRAQVDYARPYQRLLPGGVAGPRGPAGPEVIEAEWTAVGGPGGWDTGAGTPGWVGGGPTPGWAGGGGIPPWVGYGFGGGGGGGSGGPVATGGFPVAGGGGGGWLAGITGRGGAFRDLGRFFGAGIAIREVINMARLTQEYDTESLMAGPNINEQFDAMLKYRKRLEDLPVAGGLVGLIANNPIDEAFLRSVQKEAGSLDSILGARASSSQFFRTAIERGDVAREAGISSTGARELTAQQDFEHQRQRAVEERNKVTSRAAEDRDKELAAAGVRAIEPISTGWLDRLRDYFEPREGIFAGGEVYGDLRAQEAARASYSSRVSTAQAQLEKADAAAQAELREKMRLIEVDRVTENTRIASRVEVAGLRLQGFAPGSDAIQIALQRAQGEIEVARADPENRAKVQRAVDLDRDVLRMTLDQDREIRQAGRDVIVTSARAAQGRIPLLGELARIDADTQAAVLRADPSERGAIAEVGQVQRGLAIDVAVRSTMEQAQDTGAAAQIATLQAYGAHYAASRTAIDAQLKRNLRALPSSDDPMFKLLPTTMQNSINETRANYQDLAGAQRRGVDRQERQDTQMLQNAAEYWQYRAMGDEPGGYAHTAEAIKTRNDIFMNLNKAQSLQQYDLIRTAGADQLRAMERDLTAGGTVEEVAPGTLGAGWATGEDDLKMAIQKLTEAIENLSKEMPPGAVDVLSPGSDI
jgi:hypothetical protein